MIGRIANGGEVYKNGVRGEVYRIGMGKDRKCFGCV